MKRLLTLLFFAFFAITTQAQTAPNLPPGSVPFGTGLFRAPDGDIWGGSKFDGYTNLGNWQRVADSLSVKINWSDTTIIASKEWVEGKLNSLPPSGVLTVTGDGVDNTDPANPVLSYPDPSDIGALAPGDNVSELTNDAGYLDSETDPVYSGDPASGITQNDIDAWDAKQDAITGAATTVVSSNLTPSRALISNGSGKIAVSPVTSTELSRLTGVTANIQDQLDDKIPLSQKGASNGVAPIGSDGKIPGEYLPSSGSYKGTWDASTNTPTIADGVGTNGDRYRVSVGGTVDLGSGPITFVAGDDVIYNGTVWQRSPSGVTVTSVAGKTGDVVLNKADVGLGNVDNTSDLDKPISTAVQNALDLKLDASEISNYYTKTNLQTSGQAQVHWDNVTNVPGDLGAQTLSLGITAGNIAISGGNNVSLNSIAYRVLNDVDFASALPTAGVYGYSASSGTTGFPYANGTGIRVNRTSGTTAGAFDIFAGTVNDGELWYNLGTSGSSWKGFERVASKEHVSANYLSTNPDVGSGLTTVSSDVFSYTKAGAFRSSTGATNAPNSINSFSYINLYGGPGNRAMLAIPDGGTGYNDAPYIINRAGTTEWKQLALKSDIPGAQTLSLTGQQLSISGGNSVSLYGLGSSSPTFPSDLDGLEGAQFSAFTTGTANSPTNASGARGGIIQMTRSGIPSKFQIAVGNDGDIHARTLASTGWTDWKEYPDKTWVTGQINSSATPETVISTTVNFTIDWQTDTAPNSGGKTYAELHGNHFVYSAFYEDGSGAEVNYSPAVKITRNGSGAITTVQFGDIQTGNIVIK